MYTMRAIAIVAAMALSTNALAERVSPIQAGALIGTTVFSSDGAEIGTVSDVRLDETGKVIAVRINAAARLGFGTRKVELPGNAVTLVRGNFVASLPKEAVEMLPSLDPTPKTDE
jgi:sporulation protein YlmC with PRC-barrel domain